MSVKLFKPNKTVTGAAGTFEFYSFGDQRPSFFLSLVAQASWDDSTKKASFSANAKDPNKTINVKLNEFELGDFIHSFRNNSGFSSYHTFDGGRTTFNLQCLPKKKGSAEFAYESVMWGLTVVKDGNVKLKLPLETGESVRITEYIRRYFAACDDWDEVERQRLFANRNNAPANPQDQEPVQEAAAPTPPAKVAAKPAAAPVVAPEEDFEF